MISMDRATTPTFSTLSKTALSGKKNSKTTRTHVIASQYPSRLDPPFTCLFSAQTAFTQQ